MREIFFALFVAFVAFLIGCTVQVFTLVGMTLVYPVAKKLCFTFWQIRGFC